MSEGGSNGSGSGLGDDRGWWALTASLPRRWGAGGGLYARVIERLEGVGRGYGIKCFLSKEYCRGGLESNASCHRVLSVVESEKEFAVIFKGVSSL